MKSTYHAGDLRRAICGRDAAKTREIIDSAPDLVHVAQEPANGEVALHAAAAHGLSEIVLFLLALGAQVDVRDNYGQTPLHKAASSQETESASILLAHGADVNATDTFGLTPLAVARRDYVWRQTGTLACLIAHGAKDTIYDAVCIGDMEKLRAFLESSPALLNAGDASNAGMTPLIYAAHTGHLDVVAFLLESGADMYATDSLGNTPLSAAHERGHEEAAALLQSRPGSNP